MYDEKGNEISSTKVIHRGVSQGEFRELNGLRGYGVDGFKLSTGAIQVDNSLFELYAGTKALNLVGKGFNALTGGLKQWIRTGPSHSIKGGFNTVSTRWGAGGNHWKKIGNTTLQNINKSFRQTKLPGNNWRVNDSGHFHWWKK